MRMLIFIYVFSSGSSLHSQDTLALKSGEREPVIVHEITLTEVSYKKYLNLEGPLYTIPKTNVEYVRYQNGDREFFIDRETFVKPEIFREPIHIQGFNLYRF